MKPPRWMPNQTIRSKSAFLVVISVVLALGAVSANAVIAQKRAASTVIKQRGNLKVSVTGEQSPRTLPRKGVAPIAVSVGGQVTTTDQTLPPQLRVLTIDINHNGKLDYQGLPLCSFHQIQPSTNSRALAACRKAMVGQGTFSAYIVLKGQEPYATTGRLLVFNGREHGKQVLLGHIYISAPFASSFILTFDISKNRPGTYGTELTADLAKALGSRRYLTGIDMTLRRSFHSRGSRHSYLSSGCPAPKGIHIVNFPLVRTTFSFSGGTTIASTLPGTCKVRG